MFVAEKTESSLKKGLRDGQTVVWFNKKLIGRDDFLLPLIEASLKIESAKYITNSSVVHVKITNKSDAPYVLRNKSEYDFYNTTDLVTISPHGSSIIDVRTLEKKTRFDLQFEVLNAVNAPFEHPTIRFRVRPQQ